MDDKTRIKNEAEIAETKKLQKAFDEKLKAEVDALRKEAAKDGIYVSPTTINPEAIRKVIDGAKARRAFKKNEMPKDGDDI